MNRAIVQLIAGREFRDLLRDRRSLVLLLVLPIVIYPGIGLLGSWMAWQSLEQRSVVGIVGLEHLPPDRPYAVDVWPVPGGMWWTVLPGDGASAVGVASAVALSGQLRTEPALVIDGRFREAFCESKREAAQISIVSLSAGDRGPLDRREVDVIVEIPPDLRRTLNGDGRAQIELITRDGDELSRLSAKRVRNILEAYDAVCKRARFARHGLAIGFDTPIAVHEPHDDDSSLQRSSEEIREQLSKFLPFMLVMWALAGALHPAIDLCAGEKERGTMETLLISPAERSEVVTGKFLAVFGFSTATAWWNLMWMTGLCLLGRGAFGVEFVRLSGLAWCFLLAMPITALFSALCLALGVFARSTKEGQYYLLPLFLGILPLVSLSMLPGTELTLGTSMIPVTGVCLLLQTLIAPTPIAGALLYLVPVLASLGGCVLLACWWAVRQFSNERVLFREGDSSP